MQNQQQPETNEPEEKIPRSWSKRLRRWAFLFLLVPYLAVLLIFVIFQRQLVYRPVVVESLRVDTLGLDTLGLDTPGLDATQILDVQLSTTDGEMLHGWLLKAETDKESEPPLLVYFPGNSMNRHERIDDLREIVRTGFDVLIFDYRGFGDSTGSPSETALTADAKLIWNYARELQTEESRLLIFGESLGGAVALSLWATENKISPDPHPAGLILNSTFTSMPAVVAWHYPLFPFRYLLWDQWPSIDRIKNVKIPIIISHGTDDAMIPLEQGEQLAAANTKARFLKIPNGRHNEIPILQLRHELKKWIP